MAEDNFQRYLGSSLPSSVPETNSFFRKEQKKVMVMADDAEMGNFGTMTTLTHHNWCPEMLAVIRRGPLAMPTDDELIEHLRMVRYKGNRLTISSAEVKACNGMFQQIGSLNGCPLYRNERGAMVYMDGARWCVSTIISDADEPVGFHYSFESQNSLPPGGRWYHAVVSLGSTTVNLHSSPCAMFPPVFSAGSVYSPHGLRSA
jgi:hypothetical protein